MDQRADAGDQQHETHGELVELEAEVDPQLADGHPGDISEAGIQLDLANSEDRDGLTKQRVGAQNPREDFETSKSAMDFEQAIEDLVRKGANICLFRTPVTETYLEMSQTI